MRARAYAHGCEKSDVWRAEFWCLYRCEQGVGHAEMMRLVGAVVGFDICFVLSDLTATSFSTAIAATLSDVCHAVQERGARAAASDERHLAGNPSAPLD